MSHLLKLADEYQAQGVLDLCVKCLRDVRKSEENVVKVLFLVNHTVIAREDRRLDIVREECYNLIEDMELADISKKSDFKNLNRKSLQRVFGKRTGRLERFLKRVYPQFFGLVEYCMYLKLESSSSTSEITRCPQHFPKAKQNMYRESTTSNKTNVGLLQRVSSCLVCRGMITDLVSSSIESKSHVYGGDYHFDNNLISIIQDFKRTINMQDKDLFGSQSLPGFGGGLFSLASAVSSPKGFAFGVTKVPN